MANSGAREILSRRLRPFAGPGSRGLRQGDLSAGRRRPGAGGGFGALSQGQPSLGQQSEASARSRRVCSSAQKVASQPLRLSGRGYKLAVAMVRRHRLLETFFHRALHMPLERVHAEAERIEHAISDDVALRIAALLHHPQSDPHGHPIPYGDAVPVRKPLPTLASLSVGSKARVVSLDDRNDDAVAALATAGVLPGSTLRVERKRARQGLRASRESHARAASFARRNGAHWNVATASGRSSPRVVAAALDVLAGNRQGWRALLPFTGPAFVASVAYMDPGNFATNIQGGAGFGYRLLWVVVLANLMAMLFQGLLGEARHRYRKESRRAIARKPRPSRSRWGCGSSASSARWRPTWPSFSARSSGSTCSSTFRC